MVATTTFSVFPFWSIVVLVGYAAPFAGATLYAETIDEDDYYSETQDVSEERSRFIFCGTAALIIYGVSILATAATAAAHLALVVVTKVFIMKFACSIFVDAAYNLVLNVISGGDQGCKAATLALKDVKIEEDGVLGEEKAQPLSTFIDECMQDPKDLSTAMITKAIASRTADFAVSELKKPASELIPFDDAAETAFGALFAFSLAKGAGAVIKDGLGSLTQAWTDFKEAPIEVTTAFAKEFGYSVVKGQACHLMVR